MKINPSSRYAYIILTCLIVAGFISGCLFIPTNEQAVQIPTSIELTTPTPTLEPLLIPTALIIEDPKPTATSTAMPNPTATPHPMSIEALRQMSFPGSEIVIESELEPGSNYQRFYAYYLSEGNKIYGLLTMPYGTPPENGWPGIVFNHGYIPPAVYRTTERYIAYVDGFARSQYVIFRIDYRGHDRSEGEARGAYGDTGYIIDVLNAVAALKQFPAVNPQKIGMWGHSLGGYLTLRAMVVSPDIQAGVIWAGVVASYPDLITRWRRPTGSPQPTAPGFSRGWRQAWQDQYGSPEENPEFWDSVSSNHFVSEISGPVQLHHGTADEDVPLVFSELLFQEITDANGVVELYTYEGDNHNLSNYFSTAMARSIEFFDRYLKN